MKLNLLLRQFGRWTVYAKASTNNHGQSQWLCKCACGIKKIVNGNNLNRGLTLSCGCFKIERIKEMRSKNIINGKHYTKKDSTYSCWATMRKRCRNKNTIDYKNYGGRGITVCERWMKFENFLADMGERPKNKSIDRIDNNKGYSPENCQWATPFMQNNNSRNCRMITAYGKTMTMLQWSKELKINYRTLSARLNARKWKIKKALTFRTSNLFLNKIPQ